jgi:dimethylglycine catabolism B
MSSRPDERPYARLPLLAKASKELETCVFCPKLCRTTCPVSNAAPNETWTPGAKMTAGYHMARGDIAIEPESALTAYACTGCHACTHACDHKNPVAEVLGETRRELFKRKYAPKSIYEARTTWQNAEDARMRDFEKRKDATVALTGGCTYSDDVRNAALSLARHLLGVGVKVEWIPACCGKPLLAMGDEAAFKAQEQKLKTLRMKYQQVFSIDAGCSETLRTDATPLLLELAGRNEEKLKAGSSKDPVRYHDPCAMGRGLGLYDLPRSLLKRVTGHAVLEFTGSKDAAACSGGGGLLPVTMPAVAKQAAKARVADHRALGGGTLVTACASSLKSFKAAGEDAIDILEVLALALAPTE